MCRMRVWIVLFFLNIFFLPLAFAEDLVISAPLVSAEDPEKGIRTISFDASWNDSWRGSLFDPSQKENWDALWIFCKFSRQDPETEEWGEWTPCEISPEGSGAPTDARLDFAGAERRPVGVFLYSAKERPAGPVRYENVRLLWPYRDQGLLREDRFRVKIFALEMVYIPQGPFFLGNPRMDEDLATGTPHSFRVSGCENPLRNCAFRVSGEGLIDVGHIEGYLLYTGKGDLGAPLMPSFPKGFAPFYVMKYELSQGQYRDFLNTLTREEQKELLGGWLPSPGQFAFSRTETLGMYRNTIRRDPADEEDGFHPARFGCDATGGGLPDGILDQFDDGQWVAMNYMSLKGLLAYAAWAGLRPLTELEFEKAARGEGDPFPEEFAWGEKRNNAELVTNARMHAPFEAGEYAHCSHISYGTGGCNYGGALSNAPYRAGSFNSSGQMSALRRFDAGAGYYGVRELSGNVFEPTVFIGTPAGRAFAGTHGRGALDIPLDWPATTDDIILRGGSFLENNGYVATRQYLLTDKASQLYKVGARFARSAR